VTLDGQDPFRLNEREQAPTDSRAAHEDITAGG